MGLWGVGRAFSDLSFLKFLAFSTVYGRFKGRGVDLPPPPTKIRLNENSGSMVNKTYLMIIHKDISKISISSDILVGLTSFLTEGT